MATAKLSEYPRFRADSLHLRDNLTAMVEMIDGIITLDISDPAKEKLVAETVGKYLP